MFNVWIEMTYEVSQTSSVFNFKEWNILPPSSGSKNKLSMKLVISRWQRKQERDGGREVGAWMDAWAGGQVGRWADKQTDR
jgi:hypothetical protein